MRNLLVISPDWIPANLVGIQRPRLICNYLEELGWHPIIVAVHPDYYFSQPIAELNGLVSANVEVYHTKAFGRKKIPFCTASVLRGFWHLYRKAVAICNEKKIDFLWQPMPPGCGLLLARLVHNATGVPYGADYTDPWVEPSDTIKCFSKKWISNTMARFIEPYAVRKASFIAGVSEKSYLSVIERNSALRDVPTASFPLGFDIHDYDVKPNNTSLLWEKEKGIKAFVYAGAFLPQSHYYIEILFSIVSKLRNEGRFDPSFRFYFVGTGKGTLPTIADYAQKYQISDIVHENTDRISYLEVLHNLSNAYGVLAIGSIQEHYTASKIFQLVLSRRPVFAVFHQDSSVNEILAQCNADNYLVKYVPENKKQAFISEMERTWVAFCDQDRGWQPNLDALSPWSARQSAISLINLIEKALIYLKK